LNLLQKKRVTIADYSLVAGIGFISPRYFAMGRKGKQPKKPFDFSRGFLSSVLDRNIKH